MASFLYLLYSGPSYFCKEIFPCISSKTCIQICNKTVYMLKHVEYDVVCTKYVTYIKSVVCKICTLSPLP